ncbi:hypothetical protein AJ78_04268 [Emergomyces pasteurianus Ep9510]|uniref:F-box domain-containing protein n=1 Tax=Emergomyces pasteurianus Ep9510 TaxID=1447872 RepID=A0A1J9PGC3_9EURO|nr:hypothetical protein AJ78_04268 [Emergomyces pasteurianus Ep9510]
MAKLTDLALELLDLIVSFIPSTDHTILFLNLCRVTKRFRFIFQPRLYYKFACPHRPPWRNVGSISDNEAYIGSTPKRPLITFTHSLISLPEAARNVREITIECFDDDYLYGSDEEYIEPPSPKMIDDLTNAVHSVTPFTNPDRQMHAQWVANIKDLKITAITALLLSRTPNLEYLSIVLDSKPLIELGYLLGNRTAYPDGSESPYCRNLKEVKTTCAQFRNGYRLQRVAPLLRFPALKTFRAEGLLSFSEYKDGGDMASPNFFDMESETLSISHLEIRTNKRHRGPNSGLCSSSMDAESLNSLVSACKSVQTFIYTGENPPCSVADGRKQVNACDILSALQSHKNTLEEVTVDLGSMNFRLMEEGFNDGFVFKSFAEFPRLRRLDMAYYSACGARHLPASLEHLIIRDCRSGVFEYIKGVATLGIPPCLRKIELGGFIMEYLYFQHWAEAESLEEACEKMVSTLKKTKLQLYFTAHHSPLDDPDANLVCGKRTTVYIDGNGFRTDTPNDIFTEVSW